MEKRYLLWGLIFGVSAIIFGAFGAHALKITLEPEQLQSFETGIRYQMYHALFLILLSRIDLFQNKLIVNMVVIGVFLFSFSIYLLNLKEVLGVPVLKYLGPITPIGGLLLISAWAICIVKVLKMKKA